MSMWEVFILHVLSSAVIFSGDEYLWRAIAIFLEHGARIDVRFSWALTSGLWVGENSEKEERWEYDPREELDPKRYFFQLSEDTMVTFDEGDGQEFTSFDVCNKIQVPYGIAVKIAETLPNGGSLKDIFLQFGPESQPDLTALVGAYLDRKSNETDKPPLLDNESNEPEKHLDILMETHSPTIERPKGPWILVYLHLFVLLIGIVGGVIITLFVGYVWT